MLARYLLKTHLLRWVNNLFNSIIFEICFCAEGVPKRLNVLNGHNSFNKIKNIKGLRDQSETLLLLGYLFYHSNPSWLKLQGGWPRVTGVSPSPFWLR